MSTEIRNHTCCSAFCAEIKEDVRSRVQVFMFALSIILVIGLIVTSAMNTIDLTQFYRYPGTFMAVAGIIGLTTIGVLAIADVAVRTCSRMRNVNLN